MSGYYVVDWKKTETGMSPAFPDTVTGFVMVLQGSDHNFALFRTDHIPKSALNKFTLPVSEFTRELIHSATQYVPALALSKAEMRKQPFTTKEEFLAALENALRKHLRRQPVFPFFMAEVVRSDDFELAVGSFVWIMTYDPDKVGVQFVSDDYFLYQAFQDNFEIDRTLQTRAFCYQEFLR